MFDMTIRQQHSLRPVFLAAWIAVLTLLPSGLARAQVYPERSVTIIVPFAAGTITDINTRQLARFLQSQFDRPFVVDNKPGANGTIGANSAAIARSDGYTLLIGGNTTHSMVRSTSKNVPYDPVKSFTPIAKLFDFCSVLVVHPDIPAKNVMELAAYIKTNPKKLEYGYGNSGGLIGGELLKRFTGVELVRVAYRSNPQGLTDLIAGNIKMMIVDLRLAVPQITAGKIRPMAINTIVRNPLLPNVPTFGETFAPGVDAAGWAGLFGPANLPPEVVKALEPVLRKFSEDAEMNRQLSAVGTQAAWVGPGDMRTYLDADIVRWTQLAKDAGITPE